MTVIDGRYEWAKQVGLIKDYKIVGDTVEVEYWPPIRKLEAALYSDREGNIRRVGDGGPDDPDGVKLK